MILLNSAVVTVSLGSNSQVLAITQTEQIALLIMFLLAISAYYPLRRLALAHQWSKRRTRILGLLWPLLVIAFLLVCAVDLLLVALR